MKRANKAKRNYYNANRREKRAKETMSALIEDLEEQRLISTELKKQLNLYSSIPRELFIKDTAAYTQEQRQFATTLHFYSPKAYNYCRKSLTLPTESTIRKWMTAYDNRPGFTQQVFDTLKSRVQDEKTKWQFQYCSVMIDGMSIRKHLDWDNIDNKVIGYTDLGTGSVDSDKQKEATEALVIMAVGLTGHWKVTLGYFLIATVQSQLIKTAIIKLHEAGLCAVALIMDGLATNQAVS